MTTAQPFLPTQKARTDWFQSRAAWPVQEPSIENLIRERARVRAELPTEIVAEQWKSIGPENIGGRATCVVCHPAMPESVWLGSAGGGVWHSPDAGKTWHPLWDDLPSLSVGSLAIDPSHPDRLYAGTGEANQNNDSYPGVGLFCSEDAGATWHSVVSADDDLVPRRIGVVAINPYDPDHLLVGGIDKVDGAAKGLYASTDRGASWQRLLPNLGVNRCFCHDVRFHPGERGLIFAAIQTRGSNSGIWRSTDGGATWTHLGGGLPPGDRIGRASLALAPSDPDVLYVQIERRRRVLGIYRSQDRGDIWTEVGGHHFTREKQMSYNNTIAVHPEAPDTVLCGGVNLHRTQDRGRHWQQITQWNAKRGTPKYVHADQHGLLMPAARPGWVYAVNDGGLDFSEDGGTKWDNRSSGLATNMFYDLEVAQTDGAMIAGGAQDNGTLITDGAANAYYQWTGGDGGWVVIDPNDKAHIFSSSQNMQVYRFRPEDYFVDVSPPEADAIKAATWMAVLALDNRQPATLFAGSQRVWRTTDDGDTWASVSEILDGSAITALEVASADSRRLYAGTQNGGFFRSTDAGATWSDNLADIVLPGYTITRVQSRPANPDVVFATVANTGHSHVFRSVDGGITWADVDRGGLPDVPFHAIAIPAAHPDRVYVCCDAGVFVSTDEGTTWIDLTRNLPNVMVVDLVYHETNRTLTAATYGRSIWRLPVD